MAKRPIKDMTIEEARAQVQAKEEQLAAQEPAEMRYPGLDQLKAADALADGVGVTKVTFSDEEEPKVEHLSRAEFLEGGSYGSAAAMARDLELLNIKYGAQTPDWAVNTPDPHAPWPDPRPTADAPIIVTFDTSTANYAVDAVRPGETLEQALQRVGGWLMPEHITRIERPEPASDAHGMDFGDAVRCLKRGQRVQRAGWNGRGMWLEYLGVDDWTLKFSKRVEPLILLKTAQDTRVPWTASQADVLADDWRVVG